MRLGYGQTVRVGKMSKDFTAGLFAFSNDNPAGKAYSLCY